MSEPLNVFEAPLSGISLVEASAGTGKTYNITSLYVRAILELNLEPSQVLVMTYTEAATAELKFRLRNRLKESLAAVVTGNSKDDPFLEELISKKYPGAENKLKKSIDLFDEAAIFTIHGFCSRLLTEYSLQFGVSPDFELLTDESELLQDCIDDFWRSLNEQAQRDEQKLLILDYLTDEGFGPDELREVVDEILKRPNAKLVPGKPEMQELFNLLEDWESIFERAKEVWSAEKEAFKEVYFQGDLHGGIYRKEMRQPDWEKLQDWLGQSNPAISISDRLFRFGSYMQEKGSKKSYQVPFFEFFGVMDEFISLTEQLKLLKPLFIRGAAEQIEVNFEAQKESRNLLTYNDLLEVVEEGLRNSAGGKLPAKLSEKYPLALVDEFQDTDPIQYSIFKQMYEGREHACLFMIGDPKQAIYGFRGADIFTYLKAKEDASGDQSYTLSNNYRSNKLMIQGVNELFSMSESPFLFEGLSFHPAYFPDHKTDDKYLIDKEGNNVNSMQFIALNNEESSSKEAFSGTLYDTVCNEVVELLSGDYRIEDDKVVEKDIAILVRKGFEGEEIQARLRDKGLKSVLKSRTSVFDTKEASELFLVLEAIQKVSYEPGVRAALATELLGYDAQHLLNLIENEAEWSSIIQKFSDLKEVWEKRGIESTIEQMLALFDVRERLAPQNDAERRITNLLHLSELSGKAEREQHVLGKTLLKWFYQKMSQSGTESEDEQLRLESDENLIQISTIHSSKGLQYPIVLCPFLWDSGASKKNTDILKFHYDDENLIDVSAGINHPERDEFKKIAEQQDKAEEVRLAYVALTRAVSACYIFLPDYKQIGDSALASIMSGFDSNKNMDYESIKATINECEYIQLRKPSEQRKIALNDDELDKPESLKAATFNRKDLLGYPRMLSYSSLAEGKEHGEVGRDYDDLLTTTKDDIVEFTKYGFPKGAGAGTCLHNIFEDITFNDPKNLEEIIRENLDYFGFESIWIETVKKWVKSTLDFNLGKPSISLSQLKEDAVLKEMEFFFPVENIQAQQLWKLIRNDQPVGTISQSLSGFMKGFIDLTFRDGDTYYILDYKSNHLGNSREDYALPKLTDAVMDSGYDLQYHIYTLALHRFLKTRMKGYSYENHFGGVLYVFLRGVEENQSGSGVFFDRPDKKLIEAMDHYFQSGRLQ